MLQSSHKRPPSRVSMKHVRSGLILLLAGFLIVYHTVKLKTLYTGSEAGAPTLTGLVHAQSVIRIFIILSLVAVVARVRGSLAFMWVGITLLVSSQMAQHFGGLGDTTAESGHYLGYLRGLIIPSVITLAWVFLPNSQERSEA